MADGRRTSRTVLRHGGPRWGLVVALSVASAAGCNAILGNEEGHLPLDGAGGAPVAHSGGAANVAGAVGKGGTEAAGGTPSSDAGAAGTPREDAGAAGALEGGSGGRGGASSGGTAGKGGASSGGASSGGVPGATTGGASTGGRGTPPPTGGAPSGGAPAACASTDPSSCPSASTVRYCEGGAYRTVACTTLCAEAGFATGPCSNTVCMCGAATDAECETGMTNLCSCATEGCTAEEANAFYQHCYQGGPNEAMIRCWAQAADCLSALSDCGSA